MELYIQDDDGEWKHIGHAWNFRIRTHHFFWQRPGWRDVRVGRWVGWTN